MGHGMRRRPARFPGVPLAVALMMAVSLPLAACANGSREERGTVTNASMSGPVHLVPADAAVTLGRPVAAECRDGANVLRYPVPCPGVIPASSIPVWSAGLPVNGTGLCEGVGQHVKLKGWFLFGAQFPVRGRRGHLVIAASPSRVDPRSFLRSFVEGETPPDRASDIRLVGAAGGAGHRGFFVRTDRSNPRPYMGTTVLTTGRGVYMGEVVMVWSTREHTYAVGVYGSTASRRVEIAIANGIRLVSPMSAH